MSRDRAAFQIDNIFRLKKGGFQLEAMMRYNTFISPAVFVFWCIGDTLTDVKNNLIFMRLTKLILSLFFIINKQNSNICSWSVLLRYHSKLSVVAHQKNLVQLLV